MARQTYAHFSRRLRVSTCDLLPHVVSTHIISGNFLSQQKVIEVLFILGTGVVIQLSRRGKKRRKAEYQTNLDLLPPSCVCPMYDLSRLVPYGDGRQRRTEEHKKRTYIRKQHQASCSFIYCFNNVFKPSFWQLLASSCSSWLHTRAPRAGNKSTEYIVH